MQTKALLLLVLISPSLYAAPPKEPSLEELLNTNLAQLPQNIEVSTASRLDQDQNKVAANTYLVTETDIALYQFKTLSEILQTMPGLYLSSDGHFHYLGTRGLSRHEDFNFRLLFLVDGVRVNENVSDAGFLAHDSLIDVESIARVEFVAGPGSALYGNNAFFGVVNIITKGVERMQGFSSKLSVNDRYARQLRLSLAHRSDNGLDSWLTASEGDWRRIKLPFETIVEDEPTLQQELNTEQNHRVQAGLQWQGWRLQGAFSERERFFPVELATTDASVFQQLHDQSKNMFVRLSHHQQFSQDWSIETNFGHSQSHYNRLLPFTRPDGGFYQLGSGSRGYWQQGELRLHNHSFADHDLLAGIEYQHDTSQQIQIGVVGENPLQSFDGSNERFGVFIQDSWQLHPEHILVLGLRQDRSRVSDSATTPRLGWVWQTSANSQLKLMHGKAFRAANFSEFSFNNSWEQATPAPEEIQTTEVTFQQQLNTALNYRLTVFYSEITDLIVTNQDTGFFENGDELLSHGLESHLEYRGVEGQRLRLTWSWQQTEYHTKEFLENSPKHLVSLQYSRIIFHPSLQAAWRINAVSRRETLLERLPGYLTHHFSLLWQPHNQLELSFALNNATSTRVIDQPLLYLPSNIGPDRTFTLSIQWRFL